MKNILSVLAIFLSSLAFSQKIVGNWSINAIPWDNAEKQYLLKKLNNEEPHNYGLMIKFSKDKTFEAYYSSPCGTDCFPASKGTYKFVGKNKIVLIVSYIEKSGFCEETYQKKGKWNLGTYKIVKTKEGFKLVK